MLRLCVDWSTSATSAVSSVGRPNPHGKVGVNVNARVPTIDVVPNRSTRPARWNVTIGPPTLVPLIKRNVTVSNKSVDEPLPTRSVTCGVNSVVNGHDAIVRIGWMTTLVDALPPMPRGASGLATVTPRVLPPLSHDASRSVAQTIAAFLISHPVLRHSKRRAAGSYSPIASDTSQPHAKKSGVDCDRRSYLDRVPSATATRISKENGFRSTVQRFSAAGSALFSIAI